MQITDCSAYEILQKERIEDVHADGYLLRHKKSGARCDASGKFRTRIKYLTLFFGRHRLTVPVLHIFWNTVFCADPGNFH